MHPIKPWITAVRDWFIPYLPAWCVQIMTGRYDFTFIAHPLSLEDLSRQFPSLKKQNQNNLKLVSLYMEPILGPRITGFRDQAGREVRGRVIFCLMSTRLLILRRKPALKKLLKTMRISEKIGAKTVGLGAFVPIVTHDGKLLARKSNLHMTTGTSFSSVIAVNNAKRLAEMCGLDLSTATIAIVGAGGSVGSLCARMMMDFSSEIIMVDKEMSRLNHVISSKNLKNVSGKKLFLTTKIEHVKYADLIITATNAPGVIVRSGHLKTGALIVDAAQPRNVSAKIPTQREDVIAVESGVAEVKGLNTNFEFDLKSYSEVYSCLAEVLILHWLGKGGKQVGAFDMSYVYMLREAAPKLGICTPAFRNHAGFVTPEDVDKVRRIIAERKDVARLNGCRRLTQDVDKFIQLPT